MCMKSITHMIVAWLKKGNPSLVWLCVTCKHSGPWLKIGLPWLSTQTAIFVYFLASREDLLPLPEPDDHRMLSAPSIWAREVKKSLENSNESFVLHAKISLMRIMSLTSLNEFFQCLPRHLFYFTWWLLLNDLSPLPKPMITECSQLYQLQMHFF